IGTPLVSGPEPIAPGDAGGHPLTDIARERRSELMAVEVRVADTGARRRVQRRARQVLIPHRQGVDLIYRGRDVRANGLSRGLRSAFIGEINEPIVRRRGNVAADTPSGAE